VNPLIALLLAGALPGHWTGTWVSAQQTCEPHNLPPAPGFADTTLRQVIHVSLGGARMRVRFSNEFGNATLTIVSAHVAVAAGGSAIKPETDRALTFAGAASVAIPAGAPMWSDPLDFPLAPLSDLAVTIYLKGAPSDVTAHPGARTPSYLLAGDHVSAAAMPDAAATEHWYFLSGVDVVSDRPAVVALGDSITDGRNAKNNGRWPDGLARRLAAKKIGVLNQGIGGNCLLHCGLGPNALARFDRDVLAQENVRWLIVLEGINDLGNHGNADQMIAAYQQIIQRAHAHGIRVYGGTIMPVEGSFYYKPEVEKSRQKVNQWIRTSGAFDAVIDFDAATRDPQNPARLAPAADSGDHLHPANPGYQIMAGAVPLGLF
jgi:lysophospholipase L1-like esterase